MTVLATYGDHPDDFGPGSRWPLVDQSISATVLNTGRPARIEDYAGLEGPLAAEARRVGFDRVAGAPIMVGGRVWGVILTSSSDTPLPDRVEDGIAAFTELVATAIANSQARDELTRLAEEQAALRRVATLVAEGASPDVVFDAVCAEVAQLAPADAAALTRYEDDGTVAVLGGRSPTGYDYVGRRFAPEGTISGLVSETRRPSRISYAEQPGSFAAAAAREMGWDSSVGAPITVEGRLWGVLAVVSTTNRPLPVDTERRLAGFTQLVATAIANTESREQLAELAEEQAALRRVATLVAQGARPAQVFQAVSAEVGRLLPADAVAISRYGPDGTVTPLGEWTPTGDPEFGVLIVGERLPLERGTSAWLVFETRRPARVDSFEGAVGRGPDLARAAGWRSSVGAPIIVEGRLWGVVSVGSKTDRLLPPETEGRLGGFNGMVATGIGTA
jgi:GAF domain-containing protein